MKVDKRGRAKKLGQVKATDRFARFRGYLKDRRVIEDIDQYLAGSRGR
jgi:hypothetical protein